MARWQQAMTPPGVLESLPNPGDDQVDLSELYVQSIMNNSSGGGVFSTTSLLKVTLQLRQRQDHSAVDDVEVVMTRLQLKRTLSGYWATAFLAYRVKPLIPSMEKLWGAVFLDQDVQTDFEVKFEWYF